MSFIERSVKSESAEVSHSILVANRGKQLQSESSGGVHRQVESDKFDFAQNRIIEGLTRKVAALHRMATLTQPGCWRSEAKRLAPEFVGGEKKNLHNDISIAWLLV